MRKRAAIALVLCGAATGCSFTPEDAAEPLAERAIENKLEDVTGEDLDLELDMGDDDGSISIGGTRDGEDFSVSIDPETGEIIVVRGDEERSAQVDLDSGSVSVEGADGSTREIEIPEPDSSSAEITDWPDDIPLPGGTVIDVARSADDTQSFLTLNIDSGGQTSAVFEAYVAALASDGFTEVNKTTNVDSGIENYDAQMTRDRDTVLISFAANEGFELATITLIRQL